MTVVNTNLSLGLQPGPYRTFYDVLQRDGFVPVLHDASVEEYAGQSCLSCGRRGGLYIEAWEGLTGYSYTDAVEQVYLAYCPDCQTTQQFVVVGAS